METDSSDALRECGEGVISLHHCPIRDTSTVSHETATFLINVLHNHYNPLYSPEKQQRKQQEA